MLRLRVLFAAGAVLLAAGLAARAQQTAGTDPLRGVEPETVVVAVPRASNSDYRLGPSDTIKITVFGEDDLSGDFQIDSAGLVRLPLIGQMTAEGLTARQLEVQIAQALDDGYLKDARVAVEVKQYRPFYVIGQVNKPGEYPYVSNMNALNAIALAGGFTEKAVESTVYVRHQGEVEEEAVPTDQLVRIRPGDVVRVRETFFWGLSDILSPLTGWGYVATQAASL